MKITIESTDELVTINGSVPARIWEGVSEGGVAVICLVTRIAVKKEADCTEFDRELAEQREPSVEALRAFPSRLVL
jgi:hypothetical protein